MSQLRDIIYEWFRNADGGYYCAMTYNFKVRDAKNVDMARILSRGA
jgi:hypothetical protein